MIEIIPAIDIIDGKCVRLSQGDYQKKSVYSATPDDMVRRYIDHGLSRIHVVDLDGAKSASPQNLPLLARLSKIPGAKIEWGGGVKSDDSVRAVLDAGASFVVVGSIAVREPQRFQDWLHSFGADRIILGADARDGKLAVNGWLEQSSDSIQSLIAKFLPELKQVICTDISKDGMLLGPSFDLYAALKNEFPQIEFTVSGGISNISDIQRLNSMGLSRVIVGKAIYEGRISLEQLANFNTVTLC
jgi:phosphoribosylformimino-5-aminoimidazole carboxamide ribotide isomerase